MAPQTEAPAAPTVPAPKPDLAPLLAVMESAAAVFADACRIEAQAFARMLHGDQLERIAHSEALAALVIANKAAVAAEADYLAAKAAQ